MTWLDTIVEQHIESEAPAMFWYWGALTAVSAIIKDNVYFDKFYYKVYPNVYTILYADSGLKKGPPINMARVLVDKVNNTRTINGRSSIQGILKKLSTSETRKGGIVINTSCGFICSSELASSLVGDDAALTILTDLFDRQYRAGNWDSLLKMETFQLKDPIVTMFGGINDAHATNLFTAKDVGGGFFARSFFIHETQTQTVNSLMFAPKIIPDYNELSKYLIEISALKGEMTLDLADRVYFNEWYNEFKNDMKEQRIHDPTGALNRYDDSIWKVAMLITLARSGQLHITREYLDEAMVVCTKLIGNVRRATMGTNGVGTLTNQKKIAIMELVERDSHMISRTQLHKKFWMHAGMTEWTEIMAQLQMAGMIGIDTIGNQVVYIMDEKQISDWVNHFAGR